MSIYFTEETGFFGSATPKKLAEKYGTPLYVYNEGIFRQRCRDMANLVKNVRFTSNFSIKANSNPYLLKIAKEEGLFADAMSPGEIFILEKAGFKPEQILYIGNNVSAEEMKYAIDRGILTSVDSLSQLETYGKVNPGGKVAIRFNPGVGAGHHEKVVTGGKKTKFGVNLEYIPQVKQLLEKYKLKLAGINQHIGSLFMEGDAYVNGAAFLLEAAMEFKGLEFIDLGGGFGIPYKKQAGQQRLDLASLSARLESMMKDFIIKYGSDVLFKIEPGRYICAESGVILGTVHSVKNNYGVRFIGTDIGFNVLKRPIMYDSHHDIEVYQGDRDASMNSDKVREPVYTADEGLDSEKDTEKGEHVTVVGNICESGDILAQNRLLPHVEEGDIIGIMDAGAYGFSMSSNYNMRLKPAEVLIDLNGNDVLIRRRDSFEDLYRPYQL